MAIQVNHNIMQRYHRQYLLDWIGMEGQARIAASKVLLVGCGALGTHIAQWLVRAGTGYLRIVDRDVVDTTNLQRQLLYEEVDAEHAKPKAEAARHRLSCGNSEVRLDAQCVDFTAANAEQLIQNMDLIIDGTDNFETRLLLNDVSVKYGLPFVYGGVVGMEGSMAVVLPPTPDGDSHWENFGLQGPCLRCLLPEVPEPGAIPTCDTAGVLGPAVGIIAGMQSVEALKIMVGKWNLVSRELHAFDFITMSQKRIALAGIIDEECPCCAKRQFDYLERMHGQEVTVLCGRDAIQIQPNIQREVDFEKISHVIAHSGRVEADKFRLRFHPNEGVEGIMLTLFKDGRALVQGVDSGEEARSLYARYFGA